MMSTFLFNKRLINTLFFCSVLAFSLPSWAVKTTLKGPPPKVTLLTIVTKVNGKWITKVDPDGVESFNVDFQYDPAYVQPDITVGNNGVSFLSPYIQSGNAPSIEVDINNNPTGYIRNIMGTLDVGQSPVPDMFQVTFVDLPVNPISGQTLPFQWSTFGVFANVETSYVNALVDSSPVYFNGNSILNETVPEPSTFVLLGMGLVALTARKKQLA